MNLSRKPKRKHIAEKEAQFNRIAFDLVQFTINENNRLLCYSHLIIFFVD